MTIKELGALIKEEVAKLGAEMKDVEDVKAQEVEADGYADTLEKHVDMQKALKIKEHKALLYLESVRRQMITLEESVRAEKAKQAQRRLRKARAAARDSDREKEEKGATNERDMKAMKAAQAQKRLRKARAAARDEEKKSDKE